MKEFKKSISIKRYYRIIHLLSADRRSQIALVEKDDEVNQTQAIIDLVTDQVILPFADYDYFMDDQTDLSFFRKVTSNKERIVTIYDSQKKQFIAKEYEVFWEKEENNFMILQNPKTKKFHIFDKEAYLHNKGIFELALDDLANEFKICSSGKFEIVIILTKDGKKGLYEIGRGLTYPIEYDDIEIHDDKMILSKNGKQQLNVGSHWSTECDKITVDSSNKNIVYYHIEDVIFVYWIGYLNGKTSIIPITKLYGEDARLANGWMTYPNHYEGIYHFIVSKNGYETICEADITGENDFSNFVRPRPVINPHQPCDHIEYREGVYVLKEGEKEKLLPVLNPEIKRNTAPIKIIELNDALNIEIGENGENRVVDRSRNMNVVATNIKSICKTDDGFIFQCSEFDVVYIKNGKEVHTIRCSKAKHLGCGFYVLEQAAEDALKSLYINGKYIDDATGSDINIHINDIPESTNKNIHITVRKQPNKTLLLRYFKKGNKIASLEYLMVTGDIKLYDDFMVKKSDGFTTIEPYFSNGILMRIEGDVDVTEVGHLGTSKEDGNIYRIGNEDFIYERRTVRLIKIPAKKERIYMAAYEGEYGTVVVNSSDKSSFEKRCLSIERISEEQFENTLQRNFASSKTLQEKYPTLVLKPVDKKE